MVSSAYISQKSTTKREMMITPFGSQLDDINKALFDYRYRKQTQHQQNNNKFYNGVGNNVSGGHQNSNNHNHNNHHQPKQVRSNQGNTHHNHHNHRHQRHQNHHHQQQQTVVGGGAMHHLAALNGNIGVNHGLVNHHQLPTPSPTPMLVKQGGPAQGPAHVKVAQVPLHQQQQQQQQIPLGNKTLLQHPQPQMFQHSYHPVSSNTISSTATSSAFPSVVAASPDNFVEELVSSSKFDPFMHSTNLSSSVSSNGGSTVSYGSNNEEYLNLKEFHNVNVNGNNVSNEFQNINNYNNKSFNYDGFNNNNFTTTMNTNEKEVDINDNSGKYHSDKNFGWLKIWGNDMSVWG